MTERSGSGNFSEANNFGGGFGVLGNQTDSQTGGTKRTIKWKQIESKDGRRTRAAAAVAANDDGKHDLALTSFARGNSSL